MRQKIFDEIDYERKYQDTKWGKTSTAGGHEPMAWMFIMKKILEEAEDAWMRGNTHLSKQKILQVAAVGVAALEQHGLARRKYSDP